MNNTCTGWFKKKGTLFGFRVNSSIFELGPQNFQYRQPRHFGIEWLCLKMMGAVFQKLWPLKIKRGVFSTFRLNDETKDDFWSSFSSVFIKIKFQNFLYEWRRVPPMFIYYVYERAHGVHEIMVFWIEIVFFQFFSNF